MDRLRSAAADYCFLVPVLLNVYFCEFLKEELSPGVYIVKKNRLRKRNFFRVKKRSESEANAVRFSAKRSEANSLRFRNFRNKAKKSENFQVFYIYLKSAKFCADLIFGYFNEYLSE